MAAINKLTVNEIKSICEKGRYGDGGNLYLNVDAKLNKNWLFIYRDGTKRPEVGLGAFPAVSLQDARKKAGEYRTMLQNGLDPKTEKLQKKQEAAKKRVREIHTFRRCAESYIELHKHGWKNKKHIQQWSNTLETYANPVIGDVDVKDIDTELVLKIIEPIWIDKNETANRVRGRIEKILDWAKVRNFRSGENPARWRGHLDLTLPHPRVVHPVEHRAALPYQEMPEFYLKICQFGDDIAALCLRLAVLTGVRSSNARLATWGEVSFSHNIWKIPKIRMKSADEEHRIPLSDECLNLLTKLQKIRESEFLFPGVKEGSPINENALLLKRTEAGYGHITVHGFRSTFKDWATEEKEYHDDVSEMALSHVIKNATKAAYKRGDLFEKRRKLMNEWAEFCCSKMIDE